MISARCTLIIVIPNMEGKDENIDGSIGYGDGLGRNLVW
jgi:hypothetical protein